MGQSLSQEIERKESAGSHNVSAMLRKREAEMRQKHEEKKAKLYIDALNDECLPIICAVDTFYEFLCEVKRPDVSIPEDPFGIGMIMEKHLRGEYLKEFVGLLQGVVEKVLTQKTEVVEERHTHVVYANMSVLRIDYFLYLHRFKVDDNVEMNTLFYFVQVGVIDMARARLPVLIYELTRATDSGVLGNAGKKLEDIATSSIHLHKAVQILANAAKQKEAHTAETGGNANIGPPDPDSRNPQNSDPSSL